MSIPPAMADQLRSKIIDENPIGKGLDAFRASYKSICNDANISCTPDALEQLGNDDLQNLTIDLLLALQSLRASRLLRSSGSGKNLFSDLSRLILTVNSDDDFDFDSIKPLLRSAIAGDNDAIFWDKVYNAVTEHTPPPMSIASSLQQTPSRHTTSSFANSNEYRADVDPVLKHEVGVPYVGLPRFHETFFGPVADLQTASEAVFKKCIEGSEPLFCNGWRGWPRTAKQDDVLPWFAELSEKLATLAEEYRSIPTYRRKPIALPNKPLKGSTAKRKPDIGFVDIADTEKDSERHWSQILVPVELKSNPDEDRLGGSWLGLCKYAREVFAAQDTRRFVFGATMCGSLMRVWEFDRLGGLASEKFDINKDGLLFVLTVLGFLWMSEEQLGFDPTFTTTANGQRFIEIERNGSKERLIIDGLMQRARCILGRATTCWKAHREGQPQIPLVIKDSWQYPERDEEGELLREVTEKGVINVARYYYHETVQIHGTDDDVRNNVRGGIDVTSATNYRSERSATPSSAMGSVSRKGRSSSSGAAGQKRSSGQASAPLPRSKRSCLASQASGDLSNRVHRRVVVRDYGTPIYKASSRKSLLAAYAGCIEGHESLLKAGILHRDISINNLLINEDTNHPSLPSFLIDLDLAIKRDRLGATGAQGKTGTRAYMAIGVLLGEQHSFMHDLESFFWVLFWICIHYDAQGKDIGPTDFDNWNYMSTKKLAREKAGTVSEDIFCKTAEGSFTKYYQSLVPWVNKLRKVVFPGGRSCKREDRGLYARMRQILQEAQEDPKVAEL